MHLVVHTLRRFEGKGNQGRPDDTAPPVPDRTLDLAGWQIAAKAGLPTSQINSVVRATPNRFAILIIIFCISLLQCAVPREC